MGRTPSDGDDGFFSELLGRFSQDSADSTADAGDDELAGFLAGLDRASPEQEAAQVRSLLEGLPSQDGLGALSNQAGVLALLDADDRGADLAQGLDAPYDAQGLAGLIAGLAAGEGDAQLEVLAGLHVEGPEPAAGEGDAQLGVLAGLHVEGPEPAAGEGDAQLEVLAGASPRPTFDLPPRAQPTPAKAQQAPIPPVAPRLPPRPRPSIAPEPASHAGGLGSLTLRDLFGFEPTEEVEIPEAEVEESTGPALLEPRQAFASKRLYQFFLAHVQGRLKLEVLRFMVVSGLDRLSVGDLEAALGGPQPRLAAGLDQLIKDGLLMVEQGRFSLNPRSRNVLLLATLVAAWLDPTRYAEIEGWLDEGP